MKDKYVDMLKKGYSIDDMCKELFISRSTLYRYIAKWGLSTPPRKRRMPDKPVLTVQEYTRHKNDGLLDKQICGIVGVSGRTLWKWKRTMGLQRYRTSKGKKAK